MDSPTRFSVTAKDGIDVVQLPEELLDPLEIATVREQWFEELDKQIPQKVVVNFDVVRSFGSEAVGTLIRVAQRIRKGDGDIKLCSMGDRIREIFDICNLVPTVFEVYNSTGDAIQSFDKKSP